MNPPRLETFQALHDLGRYAHGLTLRHPTTDVTTDRERALARLAGHFADCISSLGYAFAELATGEQVHGNGVAVVEAPTGTPLPGVDALISRQAGVLLGVYVADCCAVYLVDRESGAFGLAHSGRVGTELGIVPRAIARMGEAFGVRPENLRVQLSPCIRPPHYEADFAAEIRRQCVSSGVPAHEVFDSGTSTADSPDRYYSYRMEKGATGRMLALLGHRR